MAWQPQAQTATRPLEVGLRPLQEQKGEGRPEGWVPVVHWKEKILSKRFKYQLRATACNYM